MEMKQDSFVANHLPAIYQGGNIQCSTLRLLKAFLQSGISSWCEQHFFAFSLATVRLLAVQTSSPEDSSLEAVESVFFEMGFDSRAPEKAEDFFSFPAVKKAATAHKVTGAQARNVKVDVFSVFKSVDPKDLVGFLRVSSFLAVKSASKR